MSFLNRTQHGAGMLLLAFFIVADACHTGDTRVESQGLSNTQEKTAAASKAESWCRRLSEMKVMPFGKEGGNDEIYNGLAESGEAAIPCLIDQLTNTTPMTDPRREPTHSDFFTVGDAAFFTLIRLVDVSFAEIFPDELMKRWRDNGVYGYFEYASTDQNRKALQSKWRHWYESKRKTAQRSQPS